MLCLIILSLTGILTVSRAAGVGSNKFEHYLDNVWPSPDFFLGYQDHFYDSGSQPANELIAPASGVQAYGTSEPMMHGFQYDGAYAQGQASGGVIHPREQQQTFHDYMFNNNEETTRGQAAQHVERPALPSSRRPSEKRLTERDSTERRREAISSTREVLGGDDEVDDDDGLRISTSPTQGLVGLEDLRLRMNTLWHRKGLWVGMEAKELAAGLAEIRIEMGTDRSQTVGRLLANHIKLEDDVSDDYIKDLRAWAKKINMKLRRLNERCDRARPPLSENQRVDETLKYIRFLKTRPQYLYMVRNSVGKRRDEKKDEEKIAIRKEALMVWTTLLQEAPMRLSKSKGSIDVEEVEKESRYLSVFLDPYKMDEVADFIRFYLSDSLHLTRAQIDVFNRARNQWLQRCHEQN